MYQGARVQFGAVVQFSRVDVVSARPDLGLCHSNTPETNIEGKDTKVCEDMRIFALAKSSSAAKVWGEANDKSSR